MFLFQFLSITLFVNFFLTTCLHHIITWSLSTCLSSLSIRLYHNHFYQLAFITFPSFNFSLSTCLRHVRLFQLLSTWHLLPLYRPEPRLTRVWTLSSNLEPVSMLQGGKPCDTFSSRNLVHVFFAIATFPELSLNLGGPDLFLNLFWAPADADWNCLSLSQPLPCSALFESTYHDLSICLSFCLSVFFLFLSVLFSFDVSIFLCFVCLSFYPQDFCVFLPICLSIYLANYLFVCLYEQRILFG